MEEVTVIIPTFNREKSLNTLLKVLLQQELQKYIFKIFILNTAGNKLVLPKNKKINQINKHKNLLKAKNYCITLVKTKYILFLDDDVAFNKSTLIKFIKLCKKHNVNGATGVVRSKVNYGFDLLSLTKYAKLSFYKLPSINYKNYIKKPIYKASFFPGCFWFVKTKLLKTNKFDTNYILPFFNEDTDLTLNLSKKYGKFFVFTNIFVLHKQIKSGGVRRPLAKSKWFYAFGFNNSYYYFKNFNFVYFLLYLVLRFRDIFFVLRQLNFKIYKFYLLGIVNGYKKAKK